MPVEAREKVLYLNCDRNCQNVRAASKTIYLYLSFDDMIESQFVNPDCFKKSP